MKENQWIIDYLIMLIIGIGLFLGLILSLIGMILGLIGGICMYLIHTAFFYIGIIKKEALS